MTIQTYYRSVLWLPIIVPMFVAILVHGYRVMVDAGPLRTVVQLLLMSLIYGGVPYMALALWTTWWIGGRPEPEIKRLVLRAPLVMAGLYLPFAVLFGVVVGQPMASLTVGVLGAIVTIPMGYGYVGLVLLMREALGPRAA